MAHRLYDSDRTLELRQAIKGLEHLFKKASLEEPLTTSNDPLADYETHLRLKGLSPRTIGNYLYYLGHLQQLLGHETLATTGIYTQLVDEMTKKIALETETALEGVAEKDDDGLVKERGPGYEAEEGKWAGFVRWAVREQEADEVRGEGGRGRQRARGETA